MNEHRMITVRLHDVMGILHWVQAAAEHLHDHCDGPEPRMGPAGLRLRDAVIDAGAETS